MEEYKQVIKQAELALNNGEYQYCIEMLDPFIELFSVSTKEGVNIRIILITALSGINKKQTAIKLCKQLFKSKHSHVREEAKSLIEILNSPSLEIPNNWNINFESNSNFEENSSKPKEVINKLSDERKYINFSNIPTGETKTFKKGFIFFTFMLIISLLFLLSGCVRITDTLDLREIDSLNLEFKIESKYLKKIPWQINFEKEIKEKLYKKNFEFDNQTFILKDNGLNLKDANLLNNKILSVLSKTIASDLEEIKIDQFVKNYFFGKKYFFDIGLDLTNLQKISDLELYINIINPSKVSILKNNNQIKIKNNLISWQLLPGKENQLEFSYWYWNKLLLGTLFVISLVLIAYYIRNTRYELGSDLPQLPS